MKRSPGPRSAVVVGLFVLASSVLASAVADHSAEASGRAIVQAAPAAAGPRAPGRLLDLAADYCARLSRSSIDFVCLEDITERIQERNSVNYPSARPAWRYEVATHHYLYDYQFVVENGRKTEKRRMLERDGIKTNEEAVGLDTLSFFYKNVLFGPVNLLDAPRQGFYCYTLEGRETWDGRPVSIIAADPAPGLGLKLNRGTVWIREDDAAILKIAWNMADMERTRAILETAKEFKGAPQIQQVTEFGLEKNGIRFPSRFGIEEAYIDKKGRKRVRSELDVVYRDYKFFTVETSITAIKRP
jgi:hypothetical protein